MDTDHGHFLDRQTQTYSRKLNRFKCEFYYIVVKYDRQI